MSECFKMVKLGLIKKSVICCKNWYILSCTNWCVIIQVETWDDKHVSTRYIDYVMQHSNGRHAENAMTY